MAAPWIEGAPKVELHVHLEGAIPLPALLEVVEKYGGPGELDALEARFQYTDFPQFLETWGWKNAFLRTYEDFTHIAEAFARSLHEQKIVYAEAFYSPTDFAQHGLKVGRLTEAIRTGLSRVDAVEVSLVADLVRDSPLERATRTLEEVSDIRSLGVIGIGIGGSEHAYPPERFEHVYERARALGFRTSAHAGEAAGAESVRGALETLRVDRVGHGTRAVEDEALVERLAELRTPLEMCPISNVRTGVVAELSAHPIAAFVERGLVVTVNTDDPVMFQTRLADEYQSLMDVLGMERETVEALMTNAIDASWMPEEDKARRRAALAQHLSQTA